MRILVPVDGSEPALRALDAAIRRAKGSGGQVLLLNVQTAIPASVGDFVGAAAVQGHYRDEGEKALGPARQRLEAAGVAYEAETRAGSPADVIAAEARERGCDEIVMGSRGLSGLKSVILGSVADRVLHLSEVPVTIVK